MRIVWILVSKRKLPTPLVNVASFLVEDFTVAIIHVLYNFLVSVWNRIWSWIWDTLLDLDLSPFMHREQ